jgi:hypothetical protein
MVEGDDGRIARPVNLGDGLEADELVRSDLDHVPITRRLE